MHGSAETFLETESSQLLHVSQKDMTLAVLGTCAISETIIAYNP